MTHISSSLRAKRAPMAAGSAKPNGAQAARGDELPRVIVLVILGLPHLVLAHVGHHDRLALVMRQRSCITWAAKSFPLCGSRWMSRTAESPFSEVMRSVHALHWRSAIAREQRAQGVLHVAHQAEIDADHLVDLRGVELEVNLLCVKRRRSSGCR